MVRLAKKPLNIPNGIKVEDKKDFLEVNGPLGKSVIGIDKSLKVKIEGDSLFIETVEDNKESNILLGVTRGKIKNILDGLSQGFKKNLEIQGLGYKAIVEGNKIVLNLGFSHPVHFSIPEGIKVAVEKQTLISISGNNKEAVGQFAASLRAVKKPEPYKGTGIRYAGEHILRKAGKAAVGAGTGAGKK